MEGLPEFRLNSLKVSDMRLPETDIFIPPPSPPAWVAGAPYRATAPVAPAAPPERYPLYRPYQAGFIRLPGGLLRLRLGSGGDNGTDNIRLAGRTKLTADGKTGAAEIKFPEVKFEDALPGDEAFLFVKNSGETLPPEFSWAAVICSERGYLGYKGANLRLTDDPVGLSVTETLALGSRKTLIKKTHPWLLTALAASPAEGGRELDRLCSRDFRKKMKDYTIKTLPRELDLFHFEYNPKENALKITWETGLK